MTLHFKFSPGTKRVQVGVIVGYVRRRVLAFTPRRVYAASKEGWRAVLAIRRVHHWSILSRISVGRCEDAICRDATVGRALCEHIQLYWLVSGRVNWSSCNLEDGI